MLMFKNRWLRVLVELGKLVDFSEILSRFEIETASKIVWATTYPLICFVEYNSRDRKQDTFKTQ